MKIAIVGLGYVGLPLSLQFARSGASVLGLDVDRAKVDSINQGRSYIKHIPSDAIARHVKSIAWNEKAIRAFDLVLIATKHTAVDYAQLANWSGCIVDARNAMAGIPAKPGQVWKA